MRRSSVLTPTPGAIEHRSASKDLRCPTAKGSPRDRRDATHAALPRREPAVREAHRRPADAAHPGRTRRVPAPVRAPRRAARDTRLPHRPGGAARGRLDGSGDGVPAGRRARRDLERRARAPDRGGRLVGGPCDARPRRPRGPQRLVPHGQSAAPPAVGAQRGGLLGGPGAHLRHRHRVHPRAARRPSGLLAYGAGPQALARAQQRDEQGHLVLVRPAARAARIRSARLPRDRRGGLRRRGDARVQPGQRPSQPCLAVPARAPADLDRPGAAGLLGRGRALQPGRLRALLRHPRGGHRRRAPQPASTASPTTARTARGSPHASGEPWSEAC